MPSALVKNGSKTLAIEQAPCRLRVAEDSRQWLTQIVAERCREFADRRSALDVCQRKPAVLRVDLGSPALGGLGRRQHGTTLGAIQARRPEQPQRVTPPAFETCSTATR